MCDKNAIGLNGVPPDISFLFVSHFHADRFKQLASLVSQQSRTRVLLGCTGETIVGGGEEIESGPAISLWSGVLPDAQIEPFHAEFSQTPDGIVCEGIPTEQEEGRPDVQCVFVLGEPFSSVPNSLIDRFCRRTSRRSPDWWNGERADPARTGIDYFSTQGRFRMVPSERLSEAVRVSERSVSQGCRPIGTHYVVTKAEKNIVHELGGVPPMQRLRELLPTLSNQDQRLMQNGLHVGIVMNEHQETFARGDFSDLKRDRD